MLKPSLHVMDPRPRLEVPPPCPKISDETLRCLAEVFALLADPSRLRILLTLAHRGEQHVSALCERLGQAQPAVSHHLKRMRRGGLLSCRRQGKNNFYSVTPGFLGGLLQPLFAESGSARQVQLGELVLALHRR